MMKLVRANLHYSEPRSIIIIAGGHDSKSDGQNKKRRIVMNVDTKYIDFKPFNQFGNQVYLSENTLIIQHDPTEDLK